MELEFFFFFLNVSWRSVNAVREFLASTPVWYLDNKINPHYFFRSIHNVSPYHIFCYEKPQLTCIAGLKSPTSSTAKSFDSFIFTISTCCDGKVTRWTPNFTNSLCNPTQTTENTWRFFKTAQSRKKVQEIKILKPPGHVMHQQFNIQQLYVLPTLYLCVLYLSENKQRLVPLTA